MRDRRPHRSLGPRAGPALRRRLQLRDPPGLRRADGAERDLQPEPHLAARDAAAVLHDHEPGAAGGSGQGPAGDDLAPPAVRRARGGDPVAARRTSGPATDLLLWVLLLLRLTRGRGLLRRGCRAPARCGAPGPLVRARRMTSLETATYTN